MYTKEDIENAKQYLDNEGYGTGTNFTLNAVANLMAEYAAKNCVIPAVIKSVCDHPQFDILGCPFDNQECEKCQYFPSQTVL